MLHKVAFRCARHGLAETLQEGLLGGYDGVGAWALILGNVRAGDERRMVETHEGLHHELQTSSGFGLVSAIAFLLARRGFRPSMLKELFFHMVERSEATHEAFATMLSASVIGVPQTRTLLADNPIYLGHLDRGYGLAGEAELPWRLRDTAAAAVLRACMASAGLFDLLSIGFDRITSRSLTVNDFPDERLAAFERAGGPAEWPALTRDLAAEFPTRRIDEGAPHRQEVPDESEDLAEVHVLGEDVLLRRCYEHACAVLGRGMSTVPWDEQKRLAEALKDVVCQVDAELSARLNIVAERRPILDDAFDYDRQKVVLRSPLPARVVDTATTLASLSAFRSGDVYGDPHVCGVWLNRKVAEKQFAFPPGTILPDPLIALMVPVRDQDRSEIMVFGLLPPECTPRHAQDLLGEVPLLVLTTHYTLTDTALTALLRTVEPVFVLMDLPVAWHVDNWFRQDAEVQMALLPLDGIEDADLLMLAFGVDRAPGLRFLHVGSEGGVSLLTEHLRQRHGDRLTISGELVRQDAGAWNMVLNHVLGAWHVLDQDAVE